MATKKESVEKKIEPKPDELTLVPTDIPRTEKEPGIKNVSGQLITIPYDFIEGSFRGRKVLKAKKYLVLNANQVVIPVDAKVFESPAYKKFVQERMVQRID